MTLLLLEFAALSLVIVVAGTFLTRYADAIAELTGMGRSLAGIVLLAAATSLPELMVDCYAATIPAPNLAVGDLMGSCLFNLLILAVLDLWHRPRGKMLSRLAAAHALSATMSILLVSIAAVGILARIEWQLPWFGPATVAIGLAYVLGIRLVYFDQQYAAEAAPQQVEALQHAVAASVSLPRAIVGYSLATLAILLAAPFLAQTADALAEETGLGGTFVGTTLVALTTSLPEIVTTLAAVRMGAFDLAVGNIFGSNSFDMVILLFVDFFYPGPLLVDVDVTHAVTAACVILVTAVATMGILYRMEKRYWLIEPDALLVIAIVLASLGLIYQLG